MGLTPVARALELDAGPLCHLW